MNYKLRTRITSFFMFIGAAAYAQKEIVVNAVNKQMSRGEQPGYQVSIPEGKLKDVTAAYKKQLQMNTKVDAKDINGELVSYGVVNKNFSAKPFTVYSKFLETADGVDMTVFATEDSVNFIGENSDADKVTAFKKSVRDFAVVQYKGIVGKKLDAENDKLKDLKKEFDKLMEAESDNVKSISKMQRDNESYTSKIESNKTAQASKAEQVNRQQNTTNEISDKKSPEYKLANKNLKQYQDEKKSLEKDAEKMAKSIDNNNAEIKSLETKNEELKQQQAAAKEKVDAQDAVVKAIEQELSGIK